MSKAKKPTAKRKVFLVVREALDASDYDGVRYHPPSDDDGEKSYVPVRGFATRKAANEYARHLDAEIRATFAPPLLAETEEENDGKAFAVAVNAKLKELGLPACRFGKQDYDHPKQFRLWWAANAASLSAEQRAALWEPFAGMTFHTVKQVDVEG